MGERTENIPAKNIYIYDRASPSLRARQRTRRTSVNNKQTRDATARAITRIYFREREENPALVNREHACRTNRVNDECGRRKKRDARVRMGMCTMVGVQVCGSCVL